MRLDAYRELPDVVYGETSVKVLKFSVEKANKKCFGSHWHNRIELLRVTKGGLKILIKDDYKNINSGELAIICPCQLHEGFATQDDTEYNVIMFDVDDFYNATIAGKRFLKPIADAEIIFSPITADEEIISTVDSITHYHINADESDVLQIHSLIYKFLGLLYKKCNPEQKRQNPSDEKFNAVIDYVNEHFTEKISTSDLSEKFGYDEAYFCRKFKKITGISAIKYINILRLDKAQHLLKKSHYEVNLIANQCGFTDISYFAQSFHNHYGLSPTEFRKQFATKHIFRTLKR